MQRGGKYREAKYTLFGKWIHYICEKYLDISPIELADRAGLNRSTVNLQTRVGKNNPTAESIEKLVTAMRAIAREKDAPFDEEWRKLLYNAANHCTPEDVQASARALEAMIQGDTR